MSAKLQSLRGAAPRVFATTALILASAAAATAQDLYEPIDLSSSANARLLVSRQIAGNHPEPEWNCLDVLSAGTGVRAITPNYKSGNTIAIRDILDLDQTLFPETIFGTSAPTIQALVATGVVAAVEFDLFPNDPGQKPTAQERLPVIGEIRGLDELGVYGVLGYMYLYDAALFQARSAFFVEMLGGPLSQYTIWLEPVLHSSKPTFYSTRIVGLDNTIAGELRSNGGVRVPGDKNDVLDTLCYADSLIVSGVQNTIGATLVLPASPVSSLPSPVSAYVAAASTSVLGDLTVVADPATGAPMDAATGLPLANIVYATGVIRVESDVVGALTLVSAQGIELAGDRIALTPAVDDVLAVVDSSAPTSFVTVSANDSTFLGTVRVRFGAWTLSGSRNLVVGATVADTVVVTGDANSVTDGTY